MISRLAYYLLPFNVLIDSLLLFSDQLFWLPFFRAFFLISLLIHVFAVYKSHIRHYSAIIIFLFYCFAQLIFVTDFEKSIGITLKICIPISSFIIGYWLFSNLEQLRRLSKSLIFVYLILILNFILSQFFQLGEALYSEESNFRVGNFDDSWNVFTYSVLMAPFAMHFLTKRKLKIYLYIGSIINGILVFISIKRIAIIGLLSGNLIRILFVRKSLRLFYSILIVSIVSLTAFQFFKDTIIKRMEARSNRFEEGAFEREGRYLETQYVWDEVFSFEDPAKSVFGLEGFNSVGNYANGLFGERQLHVDYNLIVNTNGLLGLFLYFNIFIQMAVKFYVYRKRITIDYRTESLLMSTFWMLLINQFISSFAGQMYHISYRMIVFVFLGSILGFYYKNNSVFWLKKNEVLVK